MSEFPTLAEVVRKHRIERCSVSSVNESQQWGRCLGCDFESQPVPLKGINWDQLQFEIAAFHVSEEWEEACMVRTPEDLDSLPEESVINDAHGCTAKKYKRNTWFWIGTEDAWEPDLPALLLTNPDWSKP